MIYSCLSGNSQFPVEGKVDQRSQNISPRFPSSRNRPNENLVRKIFGGSRSPTRLSSVFLEVDRWRKFLESSSLLEQHRPADHLRKDLCFIRNAKPSDCTFPSSFSVYLLSFLFYPFHYPFEFPFPQQSFPGLGDDARVPPRHV